MKPLPIFTPFSQAIDAAKLCAALREAGIPCKVQRDGKDSVKIRPESEKTKPEAVRNFVAGFASGYMAF